MSRGNRNNNPGNIERNDTPWQGMSDEQLDERFITFKHPKWGIRAMARILITYQDKRKAKDGSKIDTVAEYIARWAPSFENPTEEYAQFIRDAIDVSEGSVITVHEYDVICPMIKAIIHFENGSMPYDDATIDQALRLAGIDVPIKAIQKSRTLKAGTVATVSTSLLGVSDMLTQTATTLKPLIAYSGYIQAVFITITLASVGVMVWARIDDAHKESRT